MIFQKLEEVRKRKNKLENDFKKYEKLEKTFQKIRVGKNRSNPELEKHKSPLVFLGRPAPAQ